MHFDLMLAGEPVPVHINKPSEYRPIHEDDIIREIPKLLESGKCTGDHCQLGRKGQGEY